MKKTLSLFLAAVMLLLAVPTAALAASPTPDATIYYDSNVKTAQLVYNATEDEVYWVSDNPAVAEVNYDTGLVTGKSAGTVFIRAYKKADGTPLQTYTVVVKARTLTGIEIASQPAKKTYFKGEDFDTAGLVVKKVYDNGDKVETTDYTLNPTVMTLGTTKVTVTYEGKTADITGIVVNDITVSKVTFTLEKNSFTAGDKLPTLTVKAEFTDSSKTTVDSGYSVFVGADTASAVKVTPSSYQLKKTDKKVFVEYQGVRSEVKSITVSDQSQYTATVSGTLSRKQYYVGQLIDFTGITLTLKNGNTPVATVTGTQLNSTYVSRKAFETDDIGANRTFTYSLTYNNKTYSFSLSGITVSRSTGYLEPYQITNVGLNPTVTYKVGHTFTLSDVLFIEFYENSYTYQKTTLPGEALYQFADDMGIYVLTSTGAQKYRNPTIIETSDICIDEDGEEYVNLMFFIGQKSYKFTVQVVRDAVEIYIGSYKHDSYMNIEEALRALINDETLQEAGQSQYYYTNISLVLGKDQETSRTFYINVPYSFEIDLAGYDLSLYSDRTLRFTQSYIYNYNVTVTNSAKTEATLTVESEDFSKKLGKNETFTLNYNTTYAAEYTLTLDVGTGGTVVTDPAAVSGKVGLNKGDDVEIKITPKSGYEIADVKLDGKSMLKDDFYNVKNGVATLELFDAEGNMKLVVTFKKAYVWDNPFTDVSPSASYYRDIQFVVINKYFEGVAADRFSPSGTMNRAMFVTVLGRLSGITLEQAVATYGTTSHYSDVKYSASTSWYVPYIAWATENGIIEGHGGAQAGTFGPTDPINHQQMYTMMRRYALFVLGENTNTVGVSLSMDDKNSVASWAVDGVKYAQKMGFLVMSNNKITPTTNAKRYELAMLLTDFCENVMDIDVDEVLANGGVDEK